MSYIMSYNSPHGSIGSALIVFFSNFTPDPRNQQEEQAVRQNGCKSHCDKISIRRHFRRVCGPMRGRQCCNLRGRGNTS
jgi:hypothetical protein